jgi:hypothetical protein
LFNISGSSDVAKGDKKIKYHKILLCKRELLGETARLSSITSIKELTKPSKAMSNNKIRWCEGKRDEEKEKKKKEKKLSKAYNNYCRIKFSVYFAILNL